MQIERQLTSRLPWVETFYPSIQEKFKELNKSLDAPPSDEVDTICLTRYAVEAVAYNPDTPNEIASRFIEVIQEANMLLDSGVPSFKICYVLNERGLKLLCL